MNCSLNLLIMVVLSSITVACISQSGNKSDTESQPLQINGGCGNPVNHKMGIYTGFTGQSPDEIDSLEFIKHSRVKVIKLMDNVGHVRDIKRENPCAVVIARFNFQDKYFKQDLIVDPPKPFNAEAKAKAESLAELWIEKLKVKIFERNGLVDGAHNLIDYYEGINEPQWVEAEKGSANFEIAKDNMRFYDAFERKRVQLLKQELNAKACIGNWGIGRPHLDLWDYFMPTIVETARQGGILCVHEYITPEDGVLPDKITDERWLELRYRRARNYILSKIKPTSSFYNAVANMKWAITEFGIDRWGNPTEDGWQKQVGRDLRGQCQYLRLIDLYKQELDKDPFVLGATIYAYEIWGWESFDLTPMIESYDYKGEKTVKDGLLTSYLRGDQFWRSFCGF